MRYIPMIKQFTITAGALLSPAVSAHTDITPHLHWADKTIMGAPVSLLAGAAIVAGIAGAFGLHRRMHRGGSGQRNSSRVRRRNEAP